MGFQTNYILALGIIACVLISSSYVMTQAISSQYSDATLINVSGKQRMYSQRIVLLVLKLSLYPHNHDAKNVLKSTILEMRKAHTALIYGDDGMNLPREYSQEIRQLYFRRNIETSSGNIYNLHDLVYYFLDEAEKIILLSESENQEKKIFLTNLIRYHGDLILPILDNVVSQYEKESQKRVNMLTNFEFVILALGLLTLLIEAVFIFRPMINNLVDKNSELLNANQKLLRNSRVEKMAALGALSAGMAHEIKNALQPIFGLGEILKAGFVDNSNKKYHKYIDLMMSSANHANGIVENVLAFTHEKNIEIIKYNALDVVVDALDFTSKLMPSTISLEINKPKSTNIPVYILSNKTKLIQVFINILKNSAQAVADKGEIKINILHTHMPDNKESFALCVEISDNGCGMDKKTIENIFNPFFTTKDVSEGTGLGLSTVYGIIQQHNGKILVDSQVGKGTTFKLFFPVFYEDGGL